MPLVKIKEKFQVTIPTELRKSVRLSVGDLLEAEAKGNTIVLKPKTVVDREAIDAAIDEGLEDLKAGRVTPKFSSVEEFKAYRKNRGISASQQKQSGTMMFCPLPFLLRGLMTDRKRPRARLISPPSRRETLTNSYTCPRGRHP